jgi:RNA polymerase-binding protein DksA
MGALACVVKGARVRRGQSTVEEVLLGSKSRSLRQGVGQGRGGQNVAKSGPEALREAGSTRQDQVATRRQQREPLRRSGSSTGRPFAPVAPVASNEKPRKNQAGFSSRELEHFRDLLLAKRREILGDMSSMEREALRSSGGSNLSTLPIHMADIGTDNYEQEFTLGLVETERKLLREINLALAKIQNGTFGICEGTGKPITKARLEVQPWARYSIEYAKQMEIRAGGIR